MNQSFTFPSDTGSLSAFSTGEDPTFLLLHGAGASDKERMKPLANALLDIGYHSLAFDFSGQGESHGSAPSSISRKIEEALYAIQHCSKTTPITLCAFSMSGQVTLGVLRKMPERIENIILFAPALYSKDALMVAFGSEFTEMIRKPENWRNNNAEEVLLEYEGKILVFIGSEDDVIPREIPDIFLSATKNAQKKGKIILPGAPHMLAKWMMENSFRAKDIVDQIEDFIR